MNFKSLVSATIAAFFIMFCDWTFAQQYNSDSWLSKPHGMITLIPTVGQRNTMLMSTFSLIPKWEFTYAVYVYNDDQDPLTDDGYSTSLYAKYMFYQNASETGGGSVKFGTGMFPGTIQGDAKLSDAFNTYWVNFPFTIPFFNNRLSWDIMPGASITRSYTSEDETNALGYTYSTRLAWYPTDPVWALVGEVYGTEGQVTANPEYKVGIRWEPNSHFNWALTYGEEIAGGNGSGFELGVMIFTPQFACIGRCKTKQ